jgi:hypothetical protein
LKSIKKLSLQSNRLTAMNGLQVPYHNFPSFFAFSNVSAPW